MLSTDSQIFHETSAVRQRILEYGKLVEELHVVVYTKRESRIKPCLPAGRNKESRIATNVFIYPTNNRFKSLYFLDAYKLSKKIIHDSKFTIHDSVITAQDPFETGLIGALLAKIYKIPLQVQIHTDFLSQFYKRESLKNRLRVMVARQVIRRASGLRVVSERIKKSILKYTPAILADRITVLPITVDREGIQQKTVTTDLRAKYPGRFIILSASRFTREKNISLAVRAMRIVARKNPNALLLLVGDGPKLESLKLLVKSYKLEGNVIFEPWADDLASYYKSADVFVLTSNYEGGARAPSEALAAGLPVIMTDVAPAGEFVKDAENGFVVPVGNAEALAEKISLLDGDEDLRKKLSGNALTTARAFPTNEEYLRAYRKTLTDLL